jgi:hypothetical protein
MDYLKSVYHGNIASVAADTGINANVITAVTQHESEINNLTGEVATLMENYSNNRVNESEALRTVANLTARMSELSNTSAREMESAQLYDMQYHRVLNFIVNSNGSLTLPFNVPEAEGPNGYTLSPGSSVTLTFSGPVALGNADAKINMHLNYIELLPNQTYNMRVIGEDGALASINATST